jgi:hypothetical protein
MTRSIYLTAAASTAHIHSSAFCFNHVHIAQSPSFILLLFFS